MYMNNIIQNKLLQILLVLAIVLVFANTFVFASNLWILVDILYVLIPLLYTIFYFKKSSLCLTIALWVPTVIAIYLIFVLGLFGEDVVLWDFVNMWVLVVYSYTLGRLCCVAKR